MFGIKSASGTFKTFNVERVFNYLKETNDKDLNYFYNFTEHNQNDFFKAYLRVSNNYLNYLFLESKFNNRPTLSEYGKNHQKSQKI